MTGIVKKILLSSGIAFSALAGERTTTGRFYKSSKRTGK